MTGLEPRLTIRAIRPLVSGLRQLGYDPAGLLQAVGLDDRMLRDPDARVPMHVAAAFMARAVDQTGDANLGLHLAEHAELGSFDVHFYAIRASPTIGAAYERLCRYQRLIHDTSRIELAVEGERATLRHRMPVGTVPPRQSMEFVLASWVRVGRIVTGVDWVPLEVYFAHAPPTDSQDHRRFFRSSVRFSTGENALVLPSRVLDTPCTWADEALMNVLDAYAADRLDQLPPADTAFDRVRRAIADDLKSGEPAARRVALHLKMSVRTLSRLLAAEGTSYRELLDAQRKELALRHLSENRLSIAEIAFLLGFAELSSFHRAFKRWTGTTPAEFRQQSHRAT